MKVTGFDKVTWLGSRGPVTVAVRGKKEVAILHALKGLTPGPLGTCADTSTAFSISFVVVRTHQPFVVTEDPCPSPGIVAASLGGSLVGRQIIQGGQGKYEVQYWDDCALARAVLAALPLDGVIGTKEGLKFCSA
jgi:hypothetical protein